MDVREYNQKALRDKIGYVSQKAILFSGTVSSNVAYGDIGENMTEDQVRRGIRIAQAEEFVQKMDGTYDAHIAQGGSNVSGGQKQRLSIARAIARNPEIYIFDDSFSALDYKTDRILRSALKEEIKDATMLIVAQRIGTIKDADRIIVLDDGKVAGMGTHEELLKSHLPGAQLCDRRLLGAMRPTQKNPLDVALYVALFPQLVAGPIVRYTTVMEDITHRRETLDEFAAGVTRFCFGLAKKMVIANAMGQIADGVFNQTAANLDPGLS